MKTDVNESIEKEPIHIGKLIEEELRRQERSVTWLSRKIHCDRRNIYDIFSRSSIDSKLLMRISTALNTDFFTYFSFYLKQVDNQINTPPPYSLRRLLGDMLFQLMGFPNLKAS